MGRATKYKNTASGTKSTGGFILESGHPYILKCVN